MDTRNNANNAIQPKKVVVDAAHPFLLFDFMIYVLFRRMAVDTQKGLIV